MKKTPLAKDAATKEKHVIFQVTTLSKTLALIIFIVMPFVGGYIGYTYAPVKVVEVERVVEQTQTPPPQNIKVIEPTERYVGLTDGVEIIFENINYTSYRIIKNGVETTGELNTERGYGDDIDATVFILNWQKSVAEQMLYVKFTNSPTKLQELNSDRTLKEASLLELALDPVVFNCPDTSYFQALFTDSQVRLSFSNGKTMLLPQVISGSGARYANSDESFVFWNKGETASIEENGELTQSDCTTNPVTW